MLAAVTAFSLIVPAASAYDFKLLDELREQEKQLNWRIDALQDEVGSKETQFKEVSSQVADLEQNIKKLSQGLKENEQRIAQINQAIKEKKQALIGVKKNVAAMVRDLNSIEDTGVLVLLLKQDNLSDVLRESEQKKVLVEEIGKKYQDITDYTNSLEAARDQLELAKLALASSRLSLDLQYQALLAERERQADLFNNSKSLLYIAEQRKQEIKQQMFAAAFDNSGSAISFEEAVGYARFAAQRIKQHTGENIPVPLLLSIVKQESNFGSYLGKGHYKEAMCSQWQIEAFVYITQRLGLDPELTPVSQPARAQSCGGAMGYAQFLPRTWLGYAERVAQMTGSNPPSPWNPEDAFMAVALKLTANGATLGDTQAERRRSQWEAAMTYFSGGRWKNPEILSNIRFYGDRVMEMSKAYSRILGQ